MLFAVTIFFEFLIYERKLTLDLYHNSEFTNLSKPLRPLDYFYIDDYKDNFIISQRKDLLKDFKNIVLISIINLDYLD